MNSYPIGEIDDLWFGAGLRRLELRKTLSTDENILRPAIRLFFDIVTEAELKAQFGEAAPPVQHGHHQDQRGTADPQ